MEADGIARDVIFGEDLVVARAFKRGIGSLGIFGYDEESRVLKRGNDHVAQLIGFFAAAQLINVNSANFGKRRCR